MARMNLKRPISILLGLVLIAGADAVLARDGGSGGRVAAARHGASVGRPGVSVAPGYQGVRPFGHPGWQGVRPIVSVHPQPGISHHRPHRPHRPHHRPVFVGSTIVFGAPFFYPSPVYVAPAPVYVEPPAYIEQSAELIYYYCADSRAYYPSVQTCPSPWVEVLPDGTIKPN